MHNMIDIKEFLDREANSNLFDLKYKNLPIWELVRFDVFNHLSERVITTNTNSISLFRKIKIYFKIFFAFVISNPLFYLSKKRILVVRASRKSFMEGRFVDPYTMDVEMNNNIKELGIYESSISLREKKHFVPNIIVVDILVEYLSKIMFLFRRKKIVLEQVIEKISQVYPEKKMDTYIEYKLFRFTVAYKLYSFILERRNVKEIYFTNYIFKQALIYAAKLKNIKVIEIQHGFITPETVDYHFPSVVKGYLTLFPDEFYYLSENLMYKVAIPLDNKNIRPLNGSFFLQKRNRYFQLNKDKRAVLFVSQMNAAEMLVFIERFCQLIKYNELDWIVYFRPHPFEYNNFKNKEYVEILEDQYNFLCISEFDDIYEYIGRVYSVVGVFSSLLIESLDFGARVYSLKKNGYEFIKEFIEENLIELVEEPVELLNSIRKNKKA